MTMELLTHGAALFCSGIAACCARSGPPAERRERVATSALMTAAMIDSAVLHAAPPIVWAAVLLGVALVVSAGRRLRSGRGGHGIHTPAGLVVMAALIASTTHGDPGAAPAAAHAHGGMAVGSATLAWLCVALAVAHVVASAHRALSGSRADRAHHAAMGGSTALMALAALL